MIELSSVSPKELEGLFEAFESAWQSGSQPSIEEYLVATLMPRSELLVSLVHMDLEYRLKAGQPVRIEEYLQRFPELKQDIAELLELLQAERRHRIVIGPPPAPSEYYERFPDLFSHMRNTPLDYDRTALLDKQHNLFTELPEKVAVIDGEITSKRYGRSGAD